MASHLFSDYLSSSYIYSQGYNHWLYNPVIYGLWTDTDFASWDRLSPLIGVRGYALALTGACLLLAQVWFARKSK